MFHRMRFGNTFAALVPLALFVHGCSSDEAPTEPQSGLRQPLDKPEEQAVSSSDIPCRRAERPRPTRTTIGFERDSLVIRVSNAATVPAEVSIEIDGQARRAVFPVTKRSGRVGAKATVEFRPRLAELGMQSADSSAAFGVTVRTAYDDGVSDARRAGVIQIERNGASLRKTDAPAMDTSVVTSSAQSDQRSGEIMKLPQTQAELMARVQALGVPADPRAVFVNASDAVEPGSLPSQEGSEDLLAQGPSITVNFCFDQKSTYVDGGFGEDFFTETTATFRDAIGTFVAMNNGVEFEFLYLNSAGCTGNLLVTPGTWNGSIFTTGIIQGRQAQVMPCVDSPAPGPDCSGTSTIASQAFQIPNVNTSGTTNVQFTPTNNTEEWNVLPVVMLALSRNPGTAMDTYDFRSRAPQDGGGNPVWIKLGRADEKILIGHEHGHRFFAFNAPLVEWGPINNYAIDDTDPDCGGGSHNVNTKEYAGSTFAEAVATFYAALTFNANSAGSCFVSNPFFPTNNPVNAINCASGQSPQIPEAFMENKCPGGGSSPSMAGNAIEVDWLRQLWDVRMQGASPPSLNTMLGWINSSGYTTTNTYEFLNFRAAFVTGGQLWTNWHANDQLNGIDHPLDRLYWHNGTTGATQLWYVSGHVRDSFANLDPSLDTPDSTGWRPVLVGQFDQSSPLDILWHNGTTGAIQVWYMSDVTRVGFADFDASLNTADSTGWRIEGTNDFNQDGKADILWHNGTSGETQVWYMNGIVRTSAASLDASLNVADSTGWRIVGTNDFNQDGKADILWHNGTSGETQVWYMNNIARTSFANLDASLNVPDNTGWRIVGTMDFNQEGKPDILWHNGTSGETQIWYMNDIVRTSAVSFDASLNTPSSTGWRIIRR
jgi:hypothetical protein